MFRLLKGRHETRAISERPEVILQERVITLQTELSKCNAVVEHRARVIKALIAALFLAFSLGLVANSSPVKQAVIKLVQELGFADAVTDFDAAYVAYLRSNYTRALRLVQPLADEGNSRAQSLLGLLYYHGRGVKQDDSKAAIWFRLAADQGEADAQFNLGVMYAEGHGVPQDYAEAVRWYRLAADQGEARAQFNLGVSYAEGQGIERDYASAYMWFNLAASRFPSSEVDRRRVALHNRDLIASKLSDEQMAEAQKRAREWKPITQHPFKE
jgi:TPR repeat protein